MEGIKQNVVYRHELSFCGVPFGLRSVGRAFFEPDKSSSSRRIDFVQLLWTLRGEGHVRVGKKEHPLRQDHAVFCFPDSPHSLRSGNEMWEYHWCTFDGPYANALLSAFQVPREPFFAGPCPVRTFARLASALRDPSLNGEKLAGGEAFRFLSQLSCKASSRSTVPALPLTELIEKLADGLGEPDLNVQSLAERLGMSRYTIHQRFKEEFGLPPKRYIDSLRLQKMLSLLRGTELTLEEIALATGLANANYLAKFFRKKMGCSPTEFRSSGHTP
ncbi:MAG: hypothetical protein A2X49_11490 [Lentisphaerae bacterium GWF2_52_8]|nr:MAG: hypothetical protein A2X49_11490 [Lentisphaerae bacterium GWF2_52_8]